MAKKKQQKKKGRAAAAAELTREEAREELLALEAIFGEDITLREDGPSLGFALRVVPHPGEAAANYVAVTLVVSFLDDYPSEELGLKLSEASNLAEPAVRQLSKQLHQAAAQYAADAEVCCFQLITLAQEFLQQHNVPPEEDGSGEPAAPQSLWHDMQQRDLDLAEMAESREQSFWAPVMGDTFFDSLEGGGLFSDAADLPVASAAGGVPASTAAVPVVAVRSKAARPPKPPKPPASAAEAAAAPAEPSRLATSSGAVPETAAGLQASAAAGAAAAMPVEVAGLASLPPTPFASSAAATTQATAGPAVGRASMTGGAGSSRGGAATELAGSTSMGGGGSIMKTLGASIRGVLPRALRRYLDGGTGTTPDGSEAGEPSNLATLAEDDRALIRQELFLGHLLTLAASSGAVPPHALPSIAAQLQAEGLVPKWLAFTLTQQPALFDRAFQRAFHRELEAARQQGEEEDDPMAWAVARFWRRRAAPMMPSRSFGHLRSRSGVMSEESLPASRYESDFTELRALGRGGYGVVVAAINKMDGRQYAVKKIPLDAHSAGAYARIMREVTTLSRLQHINVVRYFQAWVEASAAVSGDEDSELDEWGSDTLASTPVSPSGLTGTGRPSAGRPGSSGWPVPSHLAPVEEASREGRASTPSKSKPRLHAAAGRRRRSGDSSGGSGTDSEASDLDGSDESGSPSDSSSSEGGEESEARSTSFAGFGGNMAVAGAHQLLSTHSVDSPPTSRAQSSLEGAGGFLSAWDSPSQSTSQSHSQSGTLSSSGGGAAGALPPRTGRRGSAPAPLARDVAAAGASSDFTFDRSWPAGGGGLSGTATGTTHPSQPSRQGSRRGVQQVLFISMEFCPRTLRDVLDSRELDEERRWSILRQILAGLAHIHAQGIIHRDLKPANTFLDSQGNVKLGDFGLAKYNTDGGGEAEPSPSTHGAGLGGAASALFSDTTGLVGTSYYISPEIREGWASYDAKVDCFSLGVMAFELWHPFATAMERAVLLRDLRENGVMPAQFEADHPVVCRLIRWLLAPNPADRPTAVEVLRSELLPPQVLDEQLTDLLRCLPDNPAMHEKVLDAIFSLPRSLATSGGAAALEAPGAPLPVQMAVREHVVSVLRDCFQRHGAVGMCSLEVGLATGDDPPGAVQLLTQAGTKLALRWELRSAFAAWFMQQLAGAGGQHGGGGGAALLLDGLRRFEIAAVQRHAAGQGLPRSFLQADLDFVLPGERTAAELLLGDAEVITATHEALAELPECGEVEVRLGHRSLFELALAFVGVSREARNSVIQLLSTAAVASPLHATARSKRWPSIKAGLEGIGLSADAIGRCRQLVLQAAGEAESALFRLRTLLAHVAPGRGGPHRSTGRPASGASLACLDELAQLMQYLQAWGVPPGCLLVDPLLAPHSEAFSGCLFQLHLVQGATGNTAVVAAGGRYDSLLKAAWARQSALSGSVSSMPPLHAVGATLNVDRLVQVAQASARWRTPGTAAPVAGLARLSQSDVLVCSRGGGGLLKERMALARSLWDAGVAAELLSQAAPSLTEQYEYAQSRGIPFLVIIHASTFGAADTVRVKAMNARLEEDVSVSDLPSYLLNALHPHGSGPPAGSRTPHAPGARLGVEDGEAGPDQEDHSAHGWRDRQRRGGRR